MAYIQRNIPPPNRIETFSLKNFTGGLNNRSGLMEDNQSSLIRNMMFTDDVVMEKRLGTEAFDGLVLSGEITFIGEFKPYKDPDKLIRATNTEMFVDGVKVKDLTGQMHGVNYMGKFFFTDGNKLYVYGKYGQTSTTYEKVVGTAVNEYKVFEVVTPPTGFTPLDTSHVKGVTKYDYTNSKVWYEPCQFEIEDTSKNGNVVPEKVKYLVIRNDRMFVSGSEKDDDNVFITDVGNPFYFPAALPIQLPPNSDKVRGLYVYDGRVLIGREHDIFIIEGETNNPQLGFELFVLKRLNTHTGIANHDAVSTAHNFLFFVGSDGNAYSLGTTRMDERLLSTTILTRTVDFMRAPLNLTREEVQNAKAVFHKDYWYVAMGEKVLIYSYRHLGWTVFEKIGARCYYVLDDVLIWGKSNGVIAKHSNNYLDFGVPYRADWESKFFDMSDANSYKQFREFFIVAHTFEEHNSDIRMTFEVDYVDVKSDIVIENEVVRWGVSRFGDRFITRNINASLPFVIGRRGRAIRFRFTNGYEPSEPVSTYSELSSYTNRKDNLLVKVEDENAYYMYKSRTWRKMEDLDLNQTMRVYQVNGDYEFRGKR